MSVTLQYPADPPHTDTLVLPNPRLGNPDTVNVKVSHSYAMDGTIYSTKQTPSQRRLGMTFTTLREETCGSVTRTELSDLIQFIEDHIGEDIRLTDWDGIVWKGRLTTDPIATTENKNFYETTITFEGNKV